MNKLLLLLLFITGISALSACSGSKVPVIGDEESIQNLAGNWKGTYTNSITGGSGFIEFNLKAGTDSAKGNVIMTPGESTRPYEPANERNEPYSEPRSLIISFVRVTGGFVSGMLDKYLAPECDCVMETSFTGKLEGNKIKGTFKTVNTETGNSSTGKWEVEKK